MPTHMHHHHANSYPSGAGKVVHSKDMPEALRSRAKELVGTWRGLA